MSESQFNHIDDKIKEAAENFLPAYNEAAWNQMEILLDNEKEKKRIGYWWWLVPVVLLISVVLYIIIQSPVNKEVIANTGSTSSNQITKTFKSNSGNQELKMITPSSGLKKRAEKKIKNIPAFSLKTTGINSVPARTFLYKSLNIKKERIENHFGDELPDIIDPILLDHKPTSNGERTDVIESETTDKVIILNDSLSEKKEIKLRTEALNRNKNSFLSKLYLTVSSGVEAPGLKTLSNSGSSISIKSGLGLGYQINESFNVETGIFIGTKKYIAGPDYYQYPEDSYGNPVELIEVDANCFIYEIPLQINYNFYQNKSLLLNLGGGLQSFIMKKEKYIYDYLKNGTLYTSSKSYRGNMHLFSSIKISVGVEKQLNQKFSILVTPAMSIPLSGVGNGKVKLHYTSIQAGIKYFPFQKNK